MAKNTQYPNLITGRIGDAKSPRMADTIGSAAQDTKEVHMHKDSTRSASQSPRPETRSWGLE